MSSIEAFPKLPKVSFLYVTSSQFFLLASPLALYFILQYTDLRVLTHTYVVVPLKNNKYIQEVQLHACYKETLLVVKWDNAVKTFSHLVS